MNKVSLIGLDDARNLVNELFNGVPLVKLEMFTSTEITGEFRLICSEEKTISGVNLCSLIYQGDKPIICLKGNQARLNETMEWASI